MPNSNKPWKQGRKQRGVKPRELQRLLILCEDTKSSVLYFRKFKFDENEVEIACVGTGKNTDSLAEEAIAREKKARDAGKPYQQIWVVFDRDSFPPANLGRAFDLMRAHPKIEPCLSNECFELWYLLHFDFCDTPVNRHNLGKILSSKIGVPYDKADGKIYDHLESRMNTALKHADRLERRNHELRTHRENPSTRVHHLVRLLRKFAPSSE